MVLFSVAAVAAGISEVLLLLSLLLQSSRTSVSQMKASPRNATQTSPMIQMQAASPSIALVLNFGLAAQIDCVEPVFPSGGCWVT